MFFPVRDFRQIIRNEYERRSTTHRMYSLRAFARDLGIGPARLNEVLNGKKGLSRLAAEQIGTRMGMGKKECAEFCDIVESCHARSKTKRKAALARLQGSVHETQIHTLRIDAFHLISDWYHFAIIQLIELENFKNDHVWIANQLEILPSQAEAAILRLKRMGLIEEKQGRLKAVKDFISTPDVASGAIRENHRQVRAKALLALDIQPIESRDFSSVQMPIASKDLPKAKRWLRDFRRKFSADMSAADEKDSVYCLSIDFFNLTPKSKGHHL